MAVKDELISGEEIVFSTEKHWIAPLRGSWIPALLLLAAFVIRAITPEVEGGLVGLIGNLLDLVRTVLIIAGVGWIAYNIVVWRTASFVVTNRRVIREEGLLSRRSSATMLSSVTDVQTRVSFLGGRLGYGDLVIFGQSGEAASDRFAAIADPKPFRDRIMAAKVDSDEGRSSRRSADAPPSPAATSAAANPAVAVELQTLTRLAELRDSGALTVEEFEAKKAEILARI